MSSPGDTGRPGCHAQFALAGTDVCLYWCSRNGHLVDRNCSCCRFSQERIRARQERNIGGVRDGLVEGGEALSKGFVRGMTGIVTKPLEGAKSRGAFGAQSGSLHALPGACYMPLAVVG